MTPEKLALLRELIASSGGDAIFRPSSIDRVIGCPGHIIAAARIPRVKERPSEYALEGTAAHIVVQDALNGIRQPDEWTDRMVRLDKGGMEGWFVDQEMVESADIYIGEVEEREGPGTQRFVEYKLSLAVLDPTDPLLGENRGTADCIVLDPQRRRLSIIDLKYGKGVSVASTSQQLRDYALMALFTFPIEGGWSEIETRIVQPRAHDWERRAQEKPVTFTPDELMGDFLPKVIGAMEDALDPAAPLVPGSWCRWCKVADAGACPALANKAFNVAADAFAAAPLFDASSPPVKLEPSMPVLLSPLDLDPADIATILDRRDFYDDFIKGVEKRAVALLGAGIAVPGWSLKPRTGRRAFTDPATAQIALRELGLQTSAIFADPKMRSPAQLEKLLSKEKRVLLDPATPGSLVTRPQGDPTLVKADAKALVSPIAGALGPIPTPS